VEKSEAELAAAAERRKENGRRLQEMQARQRVEKASSQGTLGWRLIPVLARSENGRAGRVQSGVGRTRRVQTFRVAGEASGDESV